ncbi:MAG: class I SAM-dependent methyltransferase [Candidatus Cloacimonetes bacterium]|nr:class I SAM-dependent methyltransferase [Candidatus Cloacimonadota bacterium]MBS3768211.1 class I SAM-dependent methyltransferase [Candidatus Cloacimonadota bacterium]
MKNNQSSYPDSRIEVRGLGAKFYDTILNISSLGTYSIFIRKAINKMQIQPRDKILDLGAGSGRNALLMNRHLTEEGEIIALEISEEMIKQFRKKTRQHEHIKVFNKRIDEPLDYDEKFDKVFISFVLHGFPHAVRQKIIKNIFNALKPRGSLFLLDYNEFNLDRMPLIFKYPFKIIECIYAFDFIKKDWKKILEENGFKNFTEDLFFLDYIRLLSAKKWS